MEQQDKHYKEKNKKYYKIFSHLKTRQVNWIMDKPISLHASINSESLIQCGISPRLANSVMKLYPDSFFDLLNRRKQSFFISGEAGTGKTYYAIALALSNLCGRPLRPKNIVFSTMENILMHLRNTMQRPIQDQRWRQNYNIGSLNYDAEDITKEHLTEESYVRDLYNTAGTLIIDDLGMDKQTEWSKTIADSIINHRYSWFYPTIITSNLSPNEYSEVVGTDRVASRFMEMKGVLKFTKQHRFEIN